jgi:L-threonylcarbamoyladenylate synthase
MDLTTVVHAVDRSIIEDVTADGDGNFLLDDWDFSLPDHSPQASFLCDAAARLRTSDVPVAFPTETVYGLGADATRSSAVKGIFKAKGRPLDNPLIVHVYSLRQLRSLLTSGSTQHQKEESSSLNGQISSSLSESSDPIPEIYRPLISKFWPGPLTILLQKPSDSILALEVTAGHATFGARLPNNLLALVLIKMADTPIAAPSANASSRPSPTAAEHVSQDLNGRIELILDGGPCDVGVESTVVDGLSGPPSILRPGGVSIDQIRQCPGWQDVTIGYKDGAESSSRPRAPGMKYRHYSPKASVVLYEAGSTQPSIESMRGHSAPDTSVGIVRTCNWKPFIAAVAGTGVLGSDGTPPNQFQRQEASSNGMQPMNGSHSSLEDSAAKYNRSFFPPRPRPVGNQIASSGDSSTSSHIWDIHLGYDTPAIARGLFSALRSLDEKGVSVIIVEGIEDTGDIAAAVMNRLRKAAGTIVGR